MFAIKQMTISGANGARSTIFSGGMSDLFGAAQRQGTILGQRHLGQTGKEWYDQAVHQVQKFDDVLMRLRKIANKQAREDIAANFVGSSEDSASGSYRRNSVDSYIKDAQRYTPVNTMVFDPVRVQERVQALRDVNHDFLAAVAAAEGQWGILDAPQIIERIVEVPGAPAAFPIVPIAIGGIGLVALLALAGVFK